MEKTGWTGQKLMERRKTAVPLWLMLLGLLLASGFAATLPGCKGSSPKEQSSSNSEMPLTEYWQSLFKNDPESWKEFERIQGEFRTGRTSSALRDLQEFVKRSPQAPWAEAAEFYLAQAWTVLRKYGNAIRELDRFLDQYPKSPAVSRAMMSKAQIYLALGKEAKETDAANPVGGKYLLEAKEIFQQVSKDHSTDRKVDAEALFYTGEASSAMEDLVRAKEAYREVADTYGDTPYGSKALYSLAGLCLSEADVKGADRALREITDRYPQTSLADKASKKLEGLELVGSQAPPLHIKEWLGGPAPEGEIYRGKLTLLCFWAIWCPHCRHNIPRMEQLLETYSKKGVSVVGVTREKEGEGVEKIREFINSHPMGYPTGVDDDGKTSKEMAVTSVPCVVAVDSQGRIRWHGHPDYLSEKVIEGLLQPSS